MTTVLLVRHGRTTANAAGTLAGWTPGVLLDATGQTQVSDLAQRLLPVPLTAIVSSPLERTVQTADLLAAPRPEAVRRELDPRVGECEYGDWTGRSLKELAKEADWKVVQQHPSAAVFPGGESMAAMQARAVSAVREWNSELGKDAVYAIVSHGDVIKAVLADALGMHLDQFQRIMCDPASVSVVQYTATRPFVLRTNDTGGTFGSFAAPSRRRRRSSDAAVGGGAGS